MVETTRNILFLGNGKFSFHLMAKALADRSKPQPLNVISASLTPASAHPLAVDVMEEIGINIRSLPLLTPLDIELFNFDLVITIGDFDPSCRPNLPGMPPHHHWDCPEFEQPGSSIIVVSMFRRLRDRLDRLVKALFESGTLQALVTVRRNLELVLDNLMDGVMAHTMNRRIFYFNKAAETITGYRRRDILGRDCHEVFPGRFCGGKCSFCELPTHNHAHAGENDVVFQRPDGENRLLKMATLPLTNIEGSNVGALISFKDMTELHDLKRRLKHHHSLCGMIGKDPKMRDLFDLIREVSPSDAPVLIDGESGTGKELVANAIHEFSRRSDSPFIAVNCGALPEGVLESEMFGHVRGAFTGAYQNKKGRFELADGGTLFLDEIGELSPTMQVKLLRVLQEKTIDRVGDDHPILVNVRIISATNQNLHELMERKKFRRDLFYRLCVVPITLPPLRAKRLDIPMLVEHFLEIIAKETGKRLLVPSDEMLDVFMTYDWPGNVRELRNAIEYAYVKCHGGFLQLEHLPPELLTRPASQTIKPGPAPKLQKDSVMEALAETGGNRKAAAIKLGIGRATLYRYLKSYNLN